MRHYPSLIVMAFVLLASACTDEQAGPNADALAHVAETSTAAPPPAPQRTVTGGGAGMPTPASGRVGSALLTANRDHLAICVEGIGAAAHNTADAQRRVEAAMLRVVQHPNWVRAGLAGVRWAVDAGCPGEPFLLEPVTLVENGVPIYGLPQRVDEASRYRLFVCLLATDELARVIHGDAGVRTAPQENLCMGHQCFQVTTGLYLTRQELDDEDFLVRWLARVELTVPIDAPPDAPRRSPGPTLTP